MKRTFSGLKYLVSVFCVLALALTAAATTLYGDDFIYALYFRHGFLNFIDMTRRHYEVMNGRAVVHFLLEVILIFKDKLFFIVIPILICAVFVFAARALKADDKPLFMAFCLCGTLVLPYTVLREGVFWMAGAMNYVYPTVMAFVSLGLLERCAEREKMNIASAVVFIFAGASTEQGGAISIGTAILYTIILALKKKSDAEKLKICAVSVLLMIIGYATVVFSPSTFGRTVAETSETLGLIERLRLIYDFAIGKASAFIIFEASLLTAAVYDMRNHKLSAAVSAAAAIVCAVLKIRQAYLACGIVLTATILYTAAVRVIYDGDITAAMIVSALASVGMLLFSVTFGYRNILPCLLIMIAASAKYMCGLTDKKIVTAAVLTAVFAGSAAVYEPVLYGYAENRKIINANLAAIGDGERNFYYDTDMDEKYAYNCFFIDKYYRDAFREIYNIKDGVKIYLKGSEFSDLYLNGVHCENPIIEREGIRYYPLRNVVEAKGGEIDFDSGSGLATIKLDGNTTEFDTQKNIFTDGRQSFDANEYKLNDTKYGYMTKANQYFSAEFFKRVLRTNVD